MADGQSTNLWLADSDLIVTTLVDENDGGNGGTGLGLREALTAAMATPGEETIGFSSDIAVPGGSSVGTGEVRVPDRAFDQIIHIPAGSDIQAIVDAHGENTPFILGSGVHREQVVPKNSLAFIGEPGAILNGARPIGPFEANDGKFVADIPGEFPDQEDVIFNAALSDVIYDPNRARRDDLSVYPEMLFATDKESGKVRVFERVEALPPNAVLRQDTWYLDYENGKIVLNTCEPDRYTFELGTGKFAFGYQPDAAKGQAGRYPLDRRIILTMSHPMHRSASDSRVTASAERRA